MASDYEESDACRSRKLELLEKGYDEVLDAVKHQDDKIGRLLTGLSFLTAATLAVAGLGGAQYVTRRFDVGSFGDLPLALIFLGIFVAGVVVAVSFLLGAFSTPLRLPGQRPQGRGYKSTIYFYDIARQSLSAWTGRFDKSVADLEKDRIREYEYETHNLAARAKYKTDRVTEATTFVVTAMLPLILATVLTIVAATDQPSCIRLAGTNECAPPPPLPITQTTGLILGTVVAVAILVKYHLVISNQRQTQEDLKAASKADPLVAACVALIAGCLTAVVPDWGWRGLFLLLPAGVAVGVQTRRWLRARSEISRSEIHRAVATPSADGGDLDKKMQQLKSKASSTGFALVVMAVVALGSVVAAVFGDQGIRLVTGILIYLVLGLSDFARSLLLARSEWRRANEERSTPEGAVEQSAASGSTFSSKSAADASPPQARFVVSVGRVTIVAWDRESADRRRAGAGGLR